MKFKWGEHCEPDDFAPVCSVAAAVLGAGVLGAGASIYGANKAAGIQGDAAASSRNLMAMILGGQANMLMPFVGAGQQNQVKLSDWIDPASSTNPLSSLIKLTTPGASMTDTLKQTPGYQFTEDRGLRAVNNALAARGLAGSGGAVAKGAGDYVTGLASGTWQSVVNALQNLFTSGTGALQNATNTGVGAAGTLSGGSTNIGANIGSTLIGAGNAGAGAATATANAFGGLGSSVSTAAILQKLLGGGGGGGSTATGIYGTNSVAEGMG